MSEELIVQGPQGLEWTDDEQLMMKKLNSYTSAFYGSIKRDSFNRPLEMVDITKILETGLIQDPEKMLDNPPDGCLIPVTTYEGIPTIFGSPLWEILPGEDQEYFSLFKRYREMKAKGVTRTVHKLAVETKTNFKVLELLRRIFNWQDRVAAFDEYLSQERETMLETRRVEMENRHVQTATNLFNIASKYLTDHMDMMTPKLALQMLDLAVKLERTSLGIHASRGNGQEGPISVNVTNNVATGASANKQNEVSIVTENTDENKEKAKQILNIMNKLGVLNEEPAEVIDVEVTSDE